METIPGNITREHFLQALAEIDQNGVPPKAQSSTYDLVHDGQKYPPKYALSLANKYANGTALDRASFQSGFDKASFKKIEDCGFEIQEKEPAVYNSGNAILLTWNPKNFESGGDGASDYSLDLNPGKVERWSCHSQDVSMGDRVYLLRTGVPPRGLIARGVVVNTPYKGEDWKDPEKTRRYIDFETEEFRPGCADGLLSKLLLQQIAPSQDWSPQSSGIRLGNLDEIEKHWQASKGQHSVTALLEYAHVYIGRQQWYKDYTAMVEACRPVLSDPDKLTDDLLKRLWLEGKNGISSVFPGGKMTEPEFEAHKDELRNIARQIADSPSQETLDKILSSWKNLGFKKIYKVAIHRVFAAFYPHQFTSIIQYSMLKDVTDYLRKNLEIDIPKKDGWCDLNRELLKALDEHTSASRIIGAGEPVARNIAIMRLYNLTKSTQDKVEGETIEEPPTVSKVEQAMPSRTPNLNTILYGPPGTGKTYATVQKAVEIIERRSLDDEPREDIKHRYDQLVEARRIAFVTFHQSFSYEDFVEGIRASTVDGQITYAVEPGIFKQIAKKAEESKVRVPYVLIIDEVNRGNAASIFGELITLLEPEKRLGAEDSRTLTLPYSKEPFGVPDNLYIIGTMNTADRSLTLLDTALRRRFEFKEMEPDSKLLPESIEGIELRKMLDTMNDRIEAIYDREHRLGHAYFLSLEDNPVIAELSGIFRRHIIPLLQEYFFEDWEKIRIVLGDDQKTAAHQILFEEPYPEELFSEANSRSKVNTRYVINTEALDSPATYIGIYKPEE